MDSVDPGALLAGMSGPSTPGGASASGNVDAQILALLKQHGPAQSVQPSEAAQNAQAAASVTPQGSNGVTTWLRNAPAAAGGEMYRLYKGIRGQKLDPIEQAVLGSAEQAAPGAATAADVASTAPLAMAAPEALTGAAARFGLPALGRLAASPAAMSMVQGGLQGAATADPGQRLAGGAMGAATGGLLHGAGAGLGKIVSGLSRSPEAQALIDKGVTLPPGMLQSHGAASAIEQAATHLPFIGSRIANARGAVPAQVTQRMIQDAAAPGAAVAPGQGINDAVTDLKGGYDNAYQATLGTPGRSYPMGPVIMRTKGPDIPLTDALANVATKARGGMTAQQSAAAGQTMLAHLDATMQQAQQAGRPLDATDLQGLRSVFRDAARDVSPIDNASRAQQDLWDDAQDTVTRALNSQLPPKVAQQLQGVDAKYGKFAAVRKLAVAVKDREPTMNDWSTVIKQTTPPSVYAQGGGWNRDLVQSAAKVVKPTIAHTGASGAGLIAPIMAAVEGLTHPGAIMAHPIAAGGAAGLLGGAYGAYSKAGMRALAGQTGAQKAVLGLLNSANPSARQGLSLAIRNALQQGLLGGSSAAGLLQAPAQ